MTIEFAKSLAGHDKNHYYLILKKEERLAYLTDGSSHTIERPKKKNHMHYQIVKQIPEHILAQIKENESLTDEKVRCLVKAYERSINK